MKKYRNRVMDGILAERLESMGAVLVEGAKWCGKTTTCERQAKSSIYIADPLHSKQYLSIAETEISQLLANLPIDARKMALSYALYPPLRID